MRAFLAAIALLACAGCMSTYAPQLEGKPSARLRVVSTHAYGVTAGVLPKGCQPGINLQWDLNMERFAFLPGRGAQPKHESIGMPMTPMPEYASYSELRIPAEQPFNLAFRLAAGNIFCTLAQSFTPQDGADYEAVYREVGSNCVISVRRLAAAGSTVLPVPVEGLARVPRCP